MTKFIGTSGNLLEADVEGLVNTVNTVGVMGKGIALQFKYAFPSNFKAYSKACKRRDITLGKVFVFDNGQLTNPRWIVNFPTKGHWRSRSRIRDVAAGLDDLRRVIIKLGIASIAIPPLGCGNGGLAWAEVRPLIKEKLDGLNLEVLLYAPVGAPLASDMVISTPRPTLTPGKAALVAMVYRYSARAFGATQVEIQKLMYFLQEAGELLNLRYTAHQYGPYADNLRHVLKAVEGHYLRGFGDGSARVHDAEPIRVLPDAAAEATDMLAEEAITKRMESVLNLIEGYESAYGLELLASVHWVATHGDKNGLDAVIQSVQAWSCRKQRMFTNEHIESAWVQLHEKGWLGSASMGHRN